MVVLLLAGGSSLYARHQHAVREAALAAALQAEQAPVGPPTQPGVLIYPTEQAKDEAVEKLLTDVASRYGGSSEGEVARYFLGTMSADEGKLPAAEKELQEASQKAGADYASLAKLALAQIYFGEARSSEGEQILRDLIAHPTVFVSSDQATIALARQLAARNPAEARKLLQPLLNKPGEAGQVAGELNSSIPQ